MRRCLAEALGTLALVFAGTGAIVINDVSRGAITHVGIALTFGLVVMALIDALGDISGAHFNPAVTLGFWAARRFPAWQVLPYVGSQCAGAILASLLVRTLFPDHATLGATLPAGSWMQSFVLEVVLTAGLMFVILNVSTGAREQGLLAAVTIGGAVALEALFAGPICGASMNPARSLAPALVSGQWSALGIYLTAPVLGAWLAVGGCRGVRENCCCAAECRPVEEAASCPA
ncbi:MAG: aquaporin [Planctomycetaceae bacterium]|nr:aquaporin [Planctomycetaceae bacterium]